jgi:ATP-dependent Clp endopeptidase proteolytic subunit ClpP
MAKRFFREEVDRFHDYGLYIPQRTIYVGSGSYTEEGDESGTDGQLADRTIKNLSILDNIADTPITIIMNNPGGENTHGMAIYDAIKGCRSEVTINVLGMAMSMGSVILQSADRRLLSPNSRIMIHYGYFGMNEHAKTVYKWMEESKKSDHWMEELYLSKIREKHPTFPMAKVKRMCEFDTILNPHEAVSLGLADAILGEENG